MAAACVGWAAAEDAVAHVFVGELADTCVLEGADGHHLQRVRRLAVGEPVTAADGTGAWRRYEVACVARGRLDIVSRAPIRVEPRLDPFVTIAVALVKGGLEQVVAKCTELGVDRIEPVRTRRSVVRWDDARAESAIDKLRTVAREAAMQCRRARVAEVGPLVDVSALAHRAGLVVADRAGITAGALVPPGPQGWTVLVGPEGGLAPDDLIGFGSSVPRMSVGAHVLRAETAPVAVAAALAARRTAHPEV